MPSLGRHDPNVARYERSLVRRVALAAVCTKIVAAALAFDPLAFNVFSQPKALVASVFDFLLVGLLVALALQHRRVMLRPSPLHGAVLMFMLAYFAAAAFALDMRVAVFGTPDRQLGLISAFSNILLYGAIVMIVRTRTDLVWLGTSLATCALAVLAYEGVQLAGLDPVPWGREPSEAVFSTLGNRGVLAQLLVTLAAGAAGVALAPGTSPVIRLSSAAIGLLALSGVLAAGARAAFLGLVTGGVTIAGLRLWWEQDQRRRAIAGAAVLALFAVGVGLTSLSPVGQRFMALIRNPATAGFGAEAPSDTSVAARFDLYRVAWEQWRDRPLVGVGPDNFAVGYPSYRLPESIEFHDFVVLQTSPHSWVAKVFTDAGVLGGLAYVALGLMAIALVGHRGPRPWRLGAAAGVAAFLGGGSVSVNHIGTDWLPWVGAALAAVRIDEPGMDAPGRAPRPDTCAADARSSMAVAGTAGVLCLLFIASMISPTWAAARQAQVARVALVSSDPALHERALVASERSVELDPGQPSYWGQLAAARQQRGDLEEAAEAWARASELAPYDVRYLVELSRSHVGLAERGDSGALAQAIEAADTAARLDPNNAAGHYARALALLVADRSEEAAEASTRARSLAQPRDAVAYQVAARSFARLGLSNEVLLWTTEGLRHPTRTERTTLELRARRADALAELGRPGEAVEELKLITQTDLDHRDVRPIYSRISDELEANSVYLIVETFNSTPPWRLDSGTELGTVADNTLRPGEGDPWRAILGDVGSPDIQLSLQLRAPGEASSRRSVEIGRRSGGQNSVSISLMFEGGSARTLLWESNDGPPAILGGSDPWTFRPGGWYWLELTLRAGRATIRVTESGSSPIAKELSRSTFALTAPTSTRAARSGEVFIATTDDQTQFGGLSDRPGGFYISVPND